MRLGGQDPSVLETVVDRSEGPNAVRGGGHVRHGGAGHILHLQVRPGAVEQHHHVAVVGRGSAQSWGPTLFSHCVGRAFEENGMFGFMACLFG